MPLGQVMREDRAGWMAGEGVCDGVSEGESRACEGETRERHGAHGNDTLDPINYLSIGC